MLKIKFQVHWTDFWYWKITLKVRSLQFLVTVLIILVNDMKLWLTFKIFDQTCNTLVLDACPTWSSNLELTLNRRLINAFNNFLFGKILKLIMIKNLLTFNLVLFGRFCLGFHDSMVGPIKMDIFLGKKMKNWH